jgi:SPP1 gp7 family putative phage head morphogenesis protein
MSLLTAIRQRLKKLEPTKPYIDVEFAIDESAIYKRLKLVPYVPDELVRRKGIKIFEDMMRDEEISSSIEALKIMRLSSGWEIEPASTSEEDQYVADFVRYNFENVEGSFEADLFEIMGALEYGISISELVWEVADKGKYAGKIILRAIKSKNPKYFNIYTDDFDNILENGIVNISSIDYGKQYPVEKFVIYTFRKQYENVFGVSRIRTLYDIWYFKQLWLRAWGIYLEKFGHPIPIAKYPVGANEKLIEEIWEIVRTIKLETALMIPNNFEIEMKEVSARGGDMFKAAIDYCNTQIRKVILGQTLTSDTRGVGSYALGKVHFDILLMYLEQLGRDVAEKAINQQIIKRLVDYNFKVEDYPKFKFKSLISQDVEKIIDKYYEGVKSGIIKPVEEDEDRLREWLGLPKVKREKIEVKKQPEPAEGMVEFVEENELKKIFTGTDRKRFTKYEEKVDFAEIKYQIETGTEELNKKIAELIQDGVGEILKQTQKLEILQNKKLELLEKIVFPTTGDIKRLFNEWLKRIFETGMSIARQEILRTKRKYSEYVKFQLELDLRKIKPEEVLDYLDKHAYDLAGDIKDYIMSEYRDILKNAILRGDDIKTVMGAIDKVIREYVGSGVLEEAMPGYRLEALARTNLNQVFNMGRRQFFESPEVSGYIIGYQYSAILDPRTTEICKWLDGKTYPITSEKLELLTPPVHWNCRSILVPITIDEGVEEWDDKYPPASLLETIKKFKKM